MSPSQLAIHMLIDACADSNHETQAAMPHCEYEVDLRPITPFKKLLTMPMILCIGQSVPYHLNINHKLPPIILVFISRTIDRRPSFINILVVDAKTK
jgi:hypothetical protein